MTARRFGTLTDGTAVDAVTIAGNGLTATLIGYGAAIQDLRLGGVPHPLVLGFPSLDGYLAGGHFGAIAGRFANRIGHGRFELDGRTIQLSQNEDGNHLHGGTKGFGVRLWTLARHDERSATFRIEGADGEEGYPGNITVEATYSLPAPGTIRAVMTATTDRPTIINLAQHAYFNLDGGGSVLDHELTIPADAYLPVDPGKIPTGEIRAVEGTDFDFRAARPVRRLRDGEPVLYDHNFIVGRERLTAPRPLARLSSAKSRVALEVRSTEPGVQLYDGQGIRAGEGGINGGPYDRFEGLCLEAQNFPDAPNHKDFPSAVLRPGETYRQVTEFAFSRI